MLLTPKHTPRHEHKRVQETLLTAHLQGGLHDFLHLQLTNWANVVEKTPLTSHVGFQTAPHFLQPQFLGSGISGFLIKHFPQIFPL